MGCANSTRGRAPTTGKISFPSGIVCSCTCFGTESADHSVEVRMVRLLSTTMAWRLRQRPPLKGVLPAGPAVGKLQNGESLREFSVCVCPCRRRRPAGPPARGAAALFAMAQREMQNWMEREEPTTQCSRNYAGERPGGC